jgi:hypothetical protein
VPSFLPNIRLRARQSAAGYARLPITAIAPSPNADSRERCPACNCTEPVNLCAPVPTDNHRGIARSGPKPTPPGIIQLGGVVRLPLRRVLPECPSKTASVRGHLRPLERPGGARTWSFGYERYPSGPSKKVRTAMGRQIFVADCIGCAPKASAGKAERTARRVEYGQKKNPPGWVGELEV